MTGVPIEGKIWPIAGPIWFVGCGNMAGAMLRRHPKAHKKGKKALKKTKVTPPPPLHDPN